MKGSEGDEEAADVGDSSSGVEDKVLLSPFVSGRCDGPVSGVETWEGIGVVGLLYTGAIWKVLVVANGALTR